SHDARLPLQRSARPPRAPQVPGPQTAAPASAVRASDPGSEHPSTNRRPSCKSGTVVDLVAKGAQDLQLGPIARPTGSPLHPDEVIDIRHQEGLAKGLDSLSVGGELLVAGRAGRGGQDVNPTDIGREGE